MPQTRDERGRFAKVLALSADSPHEGSESPSFADQALQRVGSLAAPSFGNLDARIDTYPLAGSLPQSVCDDMALHPMVALAAELKTAVLVGQDFRVIHDDPRIAAICDAVWRPHHHTYVRNAMRTGVPQGFCPFEVVWDEKIEPIHVEWEPEKDEADDDPMTPEVVATEPVSEDVDSRIIARVKALQPSNVLGCTIDGVENFTGYHLITPADARLHVEDGSCLHFTHNARWGNFFGEGELKRAHEAWSWQKLVVLQMVRFTARLASPVPVIEYPAGYKPPGNLTAKAIAEGMAQALIDGDLPVICLPVSDDPNVAQWKVDFVELQTEGTIKGYLEVINYFNSQILRALLMPDSVATTQGLSANRSIGEVHQDSFYAACDGYIEELAAPLEKQVMPLIALYNFGPGEASPRVEIPPLDNDKKETLRQIIVNAARSGNLPADWAKLGGEYGIPIAESANEPEPSGTDMVNAAPTNPELGTATVEAEQVADASLLALAQKAARDELVLLAETAQKARLAGAVK